MGGMDFILRLIATMAGLWVSILLIPSFSISEGTSLGATVLTLAVIALVFTLVNSLIKPIIQILAFPLYLLTFGLFALITNALMLMLTGWLSTSIGIPFHTGDLWSCIFGGIITAVVTSLVSGVVRTER